MKLPLSFSGRNKYFAIIAAVILILVAVVVLRSSGDEGSTYVLPFDVDRAEQIETELCAFGPRYAGSEAGNQAADYIFGRMEDAGLTNVHYDGFEDWVFDIETAELSIVEYGPAGYLPWGTTAEFVHKIDFVCQGHTGSHIWEDFTDDLEVVYVGNGTDDARYQSVEGKAVLVSNDGPLSGTEMTLKAHEFGAAANIIYNVAVHEELDFPPIFKGTFPENRNYPDIASMMVSKAVGDQISADIVNGNSKLRLNLRSVVQKKELMVIIGEVEGKDPSKCVILGAHYDSCYNTVGAIDNGVGVTTILELGYQLAKHKPEYTIRFALWAAEEIGLFGSTYYVGAHEDELARGCIAYLNFDMNNVDLERGNSQPIAVWKESFLKDCNRIRDNMLDQSPELKKYNVYMYLTDLAGSSDQAPFVELGIPATSAWGSGSWEYHTYMDTTDRLNPESLQLAGRVQGTLALELAKGI